VQRGFLQLTAGEKSLKQKMQNAKRRRVKKIKPREGENEEKSNQQSFKRRLEIRFSFLN